MMVLALLLVVLVTGGKKVNSFSDLDWTVELGLEFDNTDNIRIKKDLCGRDRDC